MTHYVLTCPLCKEKLFYFKEKPFEGMYINQDTFEIYSAKINKPVNGEDAVCQFCEAELIFNNDFVIEEEEVDDIL